MLSEQVGIVGTLIGMWCWSYLGHSASINIVRRQEASSWPFAHTVACLTAILGMSTRCDTTCKGERQ